MRIPSGYIRVGKVGEVKDIGRSELRKSKSFFGPWGLGHVFVSCDCLIACSGPK